MEKGSKARSQTKKEAVFTKTTDTELSLVQERAINRQYEQRKGLLSTHNICFKVRIHLTHIHTVTGLLYDIYTHACICPKQNNYTGK